MSAAEKLKAIENERVIRRAARLLDALPQIVAVVEAAERFTDEDELGDLKIAEALAALDEALS